MLSNLARLTKRPKLQQESIRQLEVFANHLQDPKTGLYYHMWDEKSAKHTPSYWARGNGWVVMATVETLKNEPSPGSARSKRVRKLLEKQLAGLVTSQDKNTGLWRTVLDGPETYLEGSASSMFLYGVVEGNKRGLLDVPWADAIRRAWRGVASRSRRRSTSSIKRTSSRTPCGCRECCWTTTTSSSPSRS